ncbi:MAG: hypothetical protein E6J87_25780 [Deltaproteobacteria bacterium]|nr:MAG: hypothetical protein E6J87_25780 [Deltaproteobacteria bacterium]
MNTDVALARRHHAALKDLFTRQSGEAADFRALRRVLGLCQEASEAVDDAYCREKLRVVGEFAAEMLSHSEHGRWGRDSMSGAEFLRQQVLNALELFASRLYSIEALEHRGATGGSPWKIRSNFAQT